MRPLFGWQLADGFDNPQGNADMSVVLIRQVMRIDEFWPGQFEQVDKVCDGIFVRASLVLPPGELYLASP